MFDVKDKFYYEAKAKGFRARSVFKLEEIQQKHSLVKKGNNVLDLGAAPGSWTQFVARIVGDGGRVVAVDLQDIEALNLQNIEVYKYDVFSKECDVFLKEKYGRFDVLLSDMAPKTSGIKDKDQWLSVELGIQCLELADSLLKKGGNMTVKVFQGSDFNLFWFKFKKKFKIAKVIKPRAVRSTSFEVYVVGIGYVGRKE